MKCPACKNPMIVVEYKKIELDYCPDCYGAWFDSGELELLLGSLHLEKRERFVGNILRSPEAKTPEKKRRCPICAQKMKKIHIGGKPNILIDVCPRSDGLWFDGGEIGDLVKQLPARSAKKAGSRQQVGAFLKEVFQARD